MNPSLAMTLLGKTVEITVAALQTGSSKPIDKADTEAVANFIDVIYSKLKNIAERDIVKE